MQRLHRILFIVCPLLLTGGLICTGQLAREKRSWLPQKISNFTDARDMRVAALGDRLSICGIYCYVLDSEGRWSSPSFYGDAIPGISPDGGQMAWTENVQDNQAATKWKTRIYIADSRTGNVLRSFPGTSLYPESAVWSPGGREILCADDHFVYRLDARNGAILGSIRFFRERLQRAIYRETQLSADGRWIVQVTQLTFGNHPKEGQGSLALYDAGSGRRIWKIERNMEFTEGFGISPDSRVLWLNESGGATFLSAQNGKKLWRWHNIQFAGSFLMPQRLAIAADDTSCFARDQQTGRQIWRRPASHTIRIVSAPDGHYLYRMEDDGEQEIWRWRMR